MTVRGYRRSQSLLVLIAFAVVGCGQAPKSVPAQIPDPVPVVVTPAVTPTVAPVVAKEATLTTWTADPVLTRDFTQVAKVGIYQISLSPKLVEKEFPGKIRNNTLTSIFMGDLFAPEENAILVISVSGDARVAGLLEGNDAAQVVETYMRSLLFSLDFQLREVGDVEAGKLDTLKFHRKKWRAVDPDSGPVVGVSYAGADGDTVIALSLYTKETKDDSSLRLLDQMVATFKKPY